MTVLDMRVILRLEDVWPKGVTVKDAAKALEMNERSIPGLKRGTEKGSWVTLIKVQRWLAANGVDKSLEELLEVSDV